MREKLNSGNTSIIVAIIVLLVVAGGIFFISRSSYSKFSLSMTPGMQNKNEANEIKYSFANPRKSAHYESSTPEHASILAGVPVNIVVNFNFDLSNKSYIQIRKDDSDSIENSELMDYGLGETVIDKNKLTMRRNMDPNAPDGKYTIMYNVCWPDGSCHDGNFQFSINKSKASEFKDMRRIDTDGVAEVIVKMSELTFNPQNIRIDRGTKVTWVNDDDVVHYVNTDSHPAHTYEPGQNSKALSKRESYSYVFQRAGIYPYHCSAHAGVMTGSVLVE